MNVISLSPMCYAELRVKLKGAGLGHLVTGTGIVGEALNLGRAIARMDASAPVKELPADARPLVLYFPTDEARAEFVAEVTAAMSNPVEMVVP